MAVLNLPARAGIRPVYEHDEPDHCSLPGLSARLDPFLRLAWKGFERRGVAGPHPLEQPCQSLPVGSAVGRDLQVHERMPHQLHIVARQHLADGIIIGGADAVLAASIFHFAEYSVGEAKRYMADQGIEVRL